MNELYPILAALAAAPVGALLMWIVLKPRLNQAEEKGRSENALALATAQERIRAAEAHAAQQQQALESAQAYLERMRQGMTGEAAKLSQAEERASRVPHLEAELNTREKRLEQLQQDAATLGARVSELETLVAQAQKRRTEEQERLEKAEQLLAQRDHRINALLDESATLKARISELETATEKDRRAAEEKLALLNDAQARLSDAFKTISSEALKSNNKSFLELAKENLEKFVETAKGDLQQRQQAINELVKPLKESLEKVNVQIGEVEKSRLSAYTSLTEQVKSLATSQTRLQSETANLVKALRSPITRGRWGEIQLQRVVEMAGMVEYCDFIQQESVTTEDGRLRPDMIIKLPNNKVIVVDSKVSLSAYLEALESPDETTRLMHLRDHARQVRDHIKRLGNKAYWNQFEQTPEFVVLFLPGESFFSAALEQDPALIECGADEKVIMATPTTLIALLKAVAYGWRQEQLAENAQVISNLGRELYERVAILARHFASVGDNLQKATQSYNRAVGTLESRVLVSARRFKELGAATGDDIRVLEMTDVTPRELQAEELLANTSPETPHE